MNRPLWKLVLLLPLLAGCETLDLNFPEFGQAPDQTTQVSSIQCVWQPGEGVGLDNLPSRGFAGQILFFVRGASEPVPIEGDVRIYVFDNHGTLEEQSRPIHEFNFPAAVWKTYLQETNLGPAYHIFIPYTRKGGLAANCTLRVRLTSEGRPAVYSQLANITLAGRKAAVETARVVEPAADLRGDLDSLTSQAAIQRTKAELGIDAQPDPLRRLRQAADSAVQTADFSEGEGADAGETATAHFETEEPASRRYRMSGGDHTR